MIDDYEPGSRTCGIVPCVALFYNISLLSPDWPKNSAKQHVIQIIFLLFVGSSFIRTFFAFCLRFFHTLLILLHVNRIETTRILILNTRNTERQMLNFFKSAMSL